MFKPVGHIVVAFRNASDLQAASDALTKQGFVAAALVRYTPADMLEQIAVNLQHASPLASIGQEMNLVKAHRALAEDGCSFLVVHAPDDAQADRVGAVANAMRAVTAQRYGHFIIEELVDLQDGDRQVFESPERGLDSDDPPAKQTGRNAP